MPPRDRLPGYVCAYKIKGLFVLRKLLKTRSVAARSTQTTLLLLARMKKMQANPVEGLVVYADLQRVDVHHAADEQLAAVVANLDAESRCMHEKIL